MIVRKKHEYLQHSQAIMSFILDSIRMTLIIQAYFFLSTTSKISYKHSSTPDLRLGVLVPNYSWGFDSTTYRTKRFTRKT